MKTQDQCLATAWQRRLLFTALPSCESRRRFLHAHVMQVSTIVSTGRFMVLLSIIHDALALSRRPLNQAVLDGNRVILSCSTSLNVKPSWFMYTPDRNRHCVFNGLKLNHAACPNCSLNHTLDTQWDLPFIADSRHANVFECVEPGSADSAMASVTVLLSEPRCCNETADGVINLTCSVKFAGAWAPVIEWEEPNPLGNATKVLTSNNSWITIAVTNHSVSSTLSFPEGVINQSIAILAIVRFTENERPKEVTAKNTPDYKHVYEIRHMCKKEENQTEGSTWILWIILIAASILIAVVAFVGYFVIKKCFENSREPTSRPRELELLNVQSGD